MNLSPKIRKMRTGMEQKIHEVDRIASLMDEKKLIRRQVVSTSYKIFDPFDLLAPITIKSKMLLQKLTKGDLQWDEPLQCKLAREAGAVLEEMVLKRMSPTPTV